MFEKYLTSGMTGCLGAWDTFEARVTARADEGVVMAYRGDCDGLVAAAFLLHTLHGHGVEVPRSRLLWVSTDDHDYVGLRSFLREQRPAFLITLGLPLENAPTALADLVDNVTQGLFCFDHHFAAEIPTVERLVVVNPSPTVELARTKPMPASLFGYLCAERAGREAAPWLVGVALLAEGIEEQVPFFYEELSRLHDLPSPGMVGGPAGLRQTVYGRIGRLLAANFAAREPDHFALDLALGVIRGDLPGPDELLDAAGDRLARLSNTVTTEVRRHIDTWRQRIAAYLASEPLVKLEVPSDYAVTAPVASILLSHFPDKTFATYSIRGGSAQVEVRGPETGPNVLDAMADVATRVPLQCWSGQATSASATLAREHVSSLLEALSAKLDPNWSGDDEDD
jgi:hypothetical protein